MALGQFKATSTNFIPATPFDAGENQGHPLVVIVRDFKEDFKTEAFPNERPVAFVMIADLEPVKTGGKAELYVNAILGGDAVADRLRKYSGAVDENGEPVKLPVKLGMKKSEKSKGRKYRTIEPLTGEDLALAVKWDNENPTALQDERARLQAIADAEADGDAAPAKGKFSDDNLDAALAAL